MSVQWNEAVGALLQCLFELLNSFSTSHWCVGGVLGVARIFLQEKMWTSWFEPSHSGTLTTWNQPQFKSFKRVTLPLDSRIEEMTLCFEWFICTLTLQRAEVKGMMAIQQKRKLWHVKMVIAESKNLWSSMNSILLGDKTQVLLFWGGGRRGVPWMPGWGSGPYTDQTWILLWFF